MIGGQAEAKGLSRTLGDDAIDEPLLGDSAAAAPGAAQFAVQRFEIHHDGRRRRWRAHASGGGPTRCLRIEVRDSGVGIPDRPMDLVFDRFTQADASVSRQFGGTGLGLAISKRIVELMHGEIGVDQPRRPGFDFLVRDRTARAELKSPAAAAESGQAGPEHRMKLLLVEDVAVNRELIHALLAPFDLDIDDACDGEEAIAAVRRETYDLILMDVQMPVMDGLTATRRILAEGLSKAPIIAMTANVLPDQIQRCLDAGMCDHLGKPISPARLLETIVRWSGTGDAGEDGAKDLA